MAKGNFLMGRVGGKLGDMVLYSANGEMCARAYTKQVKNPRTGAQMRQRTQLANLVGVWRACSRYLRGAFETKISKSKSDYHEFSKNNLGCVKVYLDKNIAANKGATVAPYRVSCGTLPPITVINSAGDTIAQLCIGNSGEVFEKRSVADISKGIIDNNDGWSEGDKLAYLSLTQVDDAGIPRVSAKMYVLPLSLSNEAKVSTYLPSSILSDRNGRLMRKNHADSAFAFIHTSKEGGYQRVSTQSLILDDKVSINLSSPAALSRAIQSYGATTDVPLAPATVIKPVLVSDKTVTEDKQSTGTTDKPSTETVPPGGTKDDPEHIG